MTNLHAISSYGTSASSTRVRLNDWFRYLEVEVEHHYYAGLNNNRPKSVMTHPAAVTRAEFALHRLEVEGRRVVISREASPLSQGGVEERLLHRAAYGVYDFDDALFDEESRIRHLLRTQDKCRRATAAADVVITGNDYLANWAERFNKDVRVVPSCIEPNDYQPKIDWSIKGDVPTMLWLGSPNNEIFVSQIAPALLEINRRTGAVLVLISGPRHNASFGRLNQMVHRIPWKVGTFTRAMSKADVAIAPLDDRPYSRGKCAYKLLQYAATGLPIVGSPVGANQQALRRFDGLEARSVDDWVQGLMQVLTETASERGVRGAAGLKAVRSHYSFDVWKSQWCSATRVTEADRSPLTG